MIDLHAVATWAQRAARARAEAHRILATHESAGRSRALVLEDLLKKLAGLPIDVQEYFREATECLKHGLLRAAVILAWAGFIHVLLERLYSQHEADLRRVRAKWTFGSLEDLKENYTESALLDAAKEVGLIRKGQLREYQGQLGRRNRCAHPTLFSPSLNSSLGYVDEMIQQATRFI